MWCDSIWFHLDREWVYVFDKRIDFFLELFSFILLCFFSSSFLHWLVGIDFAYQMVCHDKVSTFSFKKKKTKCEFALRHYWETVFEMIDNTTIFEFFFSELMFDVWPTKFHLNSFTLWICFSFFLWRKFFNVCDN